MNEQNIREELDLMWRMLEGRTAFHLRSAIIGAKVEDRNFSVALDKVGARHLLIPVQSAPDEKGLWRNGSLNLAKVNLRGEDEKVRTWLSLRCKRADLEESFLRLAVDLVWRLSMSKSNIVQSDCLVVLNEWRDLFGGGKMSEESVIGLLGEMLFLKRLALLDPIRAWEAWEGPRGGRHDFRAGPQAVEVKTTLRPTARIVKINGVTQLLPPPGGTLHLVFTRLERVPNGLISLVRLVDELAAAGIPRTEIQDLLADLDFPALDDRAAATTYELRECAAFLVDAEFPRVVPESFLNGGPQPGVSDITYSVDLAHSTALAQDFEKVVITALAAFQR